MSCEAIQERLTEAALAHAAVEAADRAHAEQCTACARHVRFLVRLGSDLDALRVPELAGTTLAASRERALRALREPRVRRAFVWELVRALALALIALPVSGLHAFVVARGASVLLGGFFPEPLLVWLAVVYFGSLALALGVLYGSIPLVVALARRTQLELA